LAILPREPGHSGNDCGFDRYIPVKWDENPGGLMIVAWQPSKSEGVNEQGELAGRLRKFLSLICEKSPSLLQRGSSKTACKVFYEGFYMTDVWKFRPK
jgi:hypothetical protein